MPRDVTVSRGGSKVEGKKVKYKDIFLSTFETVFGKLGGSCGTL